MTDPTARELLIEHEELLENLSDVLRCHGMSSGARRVDSARKRLHAHLAATPEPVAGPTDRDLIKAAKQAINSQPRYSQLVYFLRQDSTEYEFMLLALRAAAALGCRTLTPIPLDDPPGPCPGSGS